jgi:hypothetical protein
MSTQATAEEFWAKKGDIDLYIYRKYAGSSEANRFCFSSMAPP